MMVLMGYSLGKVFVGVLCVTLGLLVLIIAYRKMLAYFGKGTPAPKDYCVLHPLETQPSSGEIEFYITSENKRNMILQLLDEKFNLARVIVEKEIEKGGNIIRFDSNLVENGTYYFQLVTENQKTMKKMYVLNK
jgi:hypothetical protein